MLSGSSYVQWTLSGWTILYVMLQCTGYVEALSQQMFLLDNCSPYRQKYTLEVDKSLLVQLSRSEPLPYTRGGHREDHCVMTLVPRNRNKRLILHLVTMEIDWHAATRDSLQIYEVRDGQIYSLTPTAGLYGTFGAGHSSQMSRDTVNDFMADSFIVEYVGIPTKTYQGFAILITEYSDVVQYKCLLDEIKCSVINVCIDVSLKCDTHDNCGRHDLTDEFRCETYPLSNSGSTPGDSRTMVLAVAVIGALTFILVLVTIVLVACLKRRRFLNRSTLLSNSNTRLCNSNNRARRTNVSRFQDTQSTLYAPPSYEDVMSSTISLHRPACPTVANEQSLEPPPPPSYETVTAAEVAPDIIDIPVVIVTDTNEMLDNLSQNQIFTDTNSENTINQELIQGVPRNNDAVDEMKEAQEHQIAELGDDNDATKTETTISISKSDKQT